MERNLESYPIRTTAVIISAIDRENITAIAEFVRRQSGQTGTATGTRALNRRVAFLGVQPSPTVTRTLGDLMAENFAVFGITRSSGHLVQANAAQGGWAVVDPSRWGALVLARALDHQWPGIMTDLAVFAGDPGTEERQLSPQGQCLAELFSLLPPVESPSFAATFTQGLTLYLPTTRKDNRGLTKERSLLANWLRTRREAGPNPEGLDAG